MSDFNNNINKNGRNNGTASETRIAPEVGTAPKTGDALETSDALARIVLKQYGIIPENLALIQGGTVKTVWKFKAGSRSLCLKRLKQTFDKVLFSVNAQIYIKNSGGLVPGVIPNMNGKPVTQFKDQLFVVYEWVDGQDLDFSRPADLKLAVQGLARFHIASKGYSSPEDARISTKLGKWPEQYQSMETKLASWMESSARSTDNASNSAYLSNAGEMIAIAEKALKILNSSAYDEIAKPGSASVVLCHQDYGKGNALAAADGVYVLDLDGVTFDLPARDLRKIIGKNAENSGQWSIKAVEDILGWYMEVNPLQTDELQALYADLTFPHWFYGLVKNQFQNGKSLKASEIERIARLESSKEEILKLCFRRSD